MKKVLITGATGFIGRNCLNPLLNSNYDVHATYMRRPVDQAVGTHWHRIDLLEHRQISALMAEVRPTHLLHFAWVTTPGQYLTSPQNVAWTSASLHLLREFVAHGGMRAVMAGTCAEYDCDYKVCREENTPLAPRSLYGICKAAMGSILQSFSAEVRLSSAWGRIFHLYGPYEHPDRLVASVIRKLLAGDQAHCTSGTQTRDFMHVHDVAEAFVALLDSDIIGAVNIASGTPVTIKEVVQAIGDKLGRSDLLAMGAMPERKSEPPVLLADVNRLTNELHWKPRFNLNSGIDDAIRWWENVLSGAQDGNR